MQFRRWANSVLKESLFKGFVMDDERLKNPDGRPGFFDEMLERIREIRLLPEHIDKIIDTYRERSEQSRYARRVDMVEIEQNDFNLNISHYVSTAEAEEEIDLKTVHGDLEKIEQAVVEAKRGTQCFPYGIGTPAFALSRTL